MKKNITKTICLIIIVSALIGLGVLGINYLERSGEELYKDWLHQKQQIESSGFANSSEARLICKELYKENITCGTVKPVYSRTYYVWKYDDGERVVLNKDHVYSQREFERYFKVYDHEYYRYIEYNTTRSHHRSHHREVTAEDIRDTDAARTLDRAMQHEREGIYDYK